MSTRPKPVSAVPRTRHEGATRSRTRIPSRSPTVTLRLAIGPDGIGLELAATASLGCLRITALSATFRGVRFPADVSGGVARFRHRRGELALLEVEAPARAVERWAGPKLRGILSTRTPDVWIGVDQARATFCVSAECDPEDEMMALSPAVAFDVHAIGEGERLHFVLANPRGANLAATATAIAIACMEAIFGPAAERSGVVFTVSRPAEALARALLPDVGARVPAVGGIEWSAIAAEEDTWVLHAARGEISSSPTGGAVRARAAANLLREGDDALARGESEAARNAYLDALERAPGHNEIALRIAAIDARTKGREESALATLAEGRRGESTVYMGTLRGELLTAIGDGGAAVASFEHEGRAEPSPALASRAYESAAALSRDPAVAAQWLDHALARSPRAVTARWARVKARLSLGFIDDALADVGFLEALARGSDAKHAVWVKAGRAFQSAGLRTRARAIFERALHYAPDDARALAGLGEALIAEGAAARGAAILAQALALTERRGESSSPVLLPLARAFAEHLDDLPTAIAHAAAVPIEADEAGLARGLEGRWRAALGDAVGASLAFARLRELATSLAVNTTRAALRSRERNERTDALVQLLVEGALLERSVRRDPIAAQRHLAAALRLAPQDANVRRAHRAAGALALAADRGVPPFDEKQSAGGDPVESIADQRQSPAAAAVDDEDNAVDSDEAVPAGWLDADTPSVSASIAKGAFDAVEPPSEDSALAARAAELTVRVQGDPANATASDELAEVLEALGRGHELLALLLGRLEDAGPENRASLLPRVREVLARLAAASEAAGRSDEAALYRSVPLA